MNYPLPTDMNVVQWLVVVYWGAIIKIKDKSLGGGRPSIQDVWFASWMTLIPTRSLVNASILLLNIEACWFVRDVRQRALVLQMPHIIIHCCCSVESLIYDAAPLQAHLSKNYVCLYWRRLRTEVWLHKHLRFWCFLFFFVIFWWWLSGTSHFGLPKLIHKDNSKTAK